jgi:hypothetical protein
MRTEAVQPVGSFVLDPAESAQALKHAHDQEPVNARQQAPPSPGGERLVPVRKD